MSSTILIPSTPQAISESWSSQAVQTHVSTSATFGINHGVVADAHTVLSQAVHGYTIAIHAVFILTIGKT